MSLIQSIFKPFCTRRILFCLAFNVNFCCKHQICWVSCDPLLLTFVQRRRLIRIYVFFQSRVKQLFTLEIGFFGVTRSVEKQPGALNLVEHVLFAVSFPLFFFELFNLTFVAGFIDESETVNLHRFAFPETFPNCSAELFSSHWSSIQVSDLRLIFSLFNLALPTTCSACRLLILNDFDYHRFFFIVAQN